MIKPDAYTHLGKILTAIDGAGFSIRCVRACVRVCARVHVRVYMHVRVYVHVHVCVCATCSGRGAA
jgi:hypothetical protein